MLNGFRNNVSLVFGLFFVLTASVLWAKTGRAAVETGNAAVEFKVLKAQEGKVTLPAVDFQDRKAKFYIVRFPEASVRFFVVGSPDGVVRAAFDACTVCFKSGKGYQQVNDRMSCNNCGNQFLINRLDLNRRGCNPVHLPLNNNGGSFTISVDDLKKGIIYFDL